MSFKKDLHKAPGASLSRVKIGAAIKRSRESAGYSVDDLSVTTGLTEIEISKIELGADTDPTKLQRIAAALQVSPQTFTTA
ncbi:MULTISPECIES: helix-turn-helix transcriptional regulator [unclassified Ensifer]|uniref:helix-turn-helix domain-containing protein n=1 Tax=unclassified Ensifer TaxID=2633371 RepID=UPI000813334E|nr:MULTISPECIES: helix-turn-helix transcriptional regulator [unclassified Ensifer]OCP01773.1 transcriptional regulator [Ensifer sp. LC14]OCP09562.1 transcriptional regulator [Ensifer sp. LC13]OCP10735.1 transcriptional regulator [Ensifer sp. LC11]OCP32809.1 transcriptional regulator [Ensifer sp. LC499]